MHIDDFREVAKKLEGEAWTGGDGNEPYLISIAISLKRLADMLAESALQVGPARRIIEATVRRQNG